VIEKIELIQKGDVRRAKLYYLRDLRGKAAKIREKRDGVVGYGDGILSTPEPIVEAVVEAPAVVEEAVVEAPVAVSEPETVAQVAEVPAEVAATDVAVETEAAAEDKPAE
jgi:hypothetical protein